MDEPNRDEALVIGAFLQRCLEDHARGELRTLAEYQAEFPGFEDAVAREYERFEQAQAGDELGPQGSVFDAMSEHFGADPDPEIHLGEKDGCEPESRLGGATRRYRVMGEVARGGFGTILRVWERDLRRTLAMKVLREQEAGTQDGARRVQPP